MEHKFNDQELDRWLRENAAPEGAPPTGDDWDSPPEQVWVKVRAGLDRRKKRRRAFYLWLSAALLLGALAGAAYWQQIADKPAVPVAMVPFPAPTKPAAEKPNSTESPSQATPTSAPTQLPANQSTSKPQTSTSKLQTSNFKLQTSNSKLQTPNFKHINTPLPARAGLPSRPAGAFENSQQPSEPQIAAPSQTPASPSQPTQSDRGAKLPDLLSDKAPNATAPQLLSPAIQQSALPALPGETIPPLEFHRQPVFPTVEIVPVKMKPAGSWYAQAVSGLFFTSRQLKNTGVQAPNGRESGAWTWQQGLHLGYRLGQHWSLETGLERSAVRLQAERTLQFQYRTDREKFNPQRFVYQNSSDQAMQTAFGEVEMRMDLSREPNRPIADLAVIRLELSTDEQVRYLRLPLLLRWTAGRGPWQWNLSGGLGLSFETGYALSLTASRSNRPGLRNISARVQQRVNGLAPAVLDAQFGAALSCRLSPAWSVGFSPEFRYGLSSMYRNGPYRSLAVSAGLQLGLQYHFL
ncbi:MAG: hypothetical protein JNK89_09105 [Saprospiraceae bacterium]|nr:hypothetical protein [Saprospiraceae bacterium]